MGNKTQEATTEKPPGLIQDILALFIKVFVILAGFILLFTFIFGICTVKDMSMKPAVQDSDIVIFYRLAKNYVESDVVALEYKEQVQIRRVIAVAGDIVDITEEGVVINGALIAEEYRQDTLLYSDGISFPVTVPEGHLFVLGDSRNGTIDSRMYGTVAIKDLLGKVTTVIRQRNL